MLLLLFLKVCLLVFILKIQVVYSLQLQYSSILNFLFVSLVSSDVFLLHISIHFFQTEQLSVAFFWKTILVLIPSAFVCLGMSLSHLCSWRIALLKQHYGLTDCFFFLQHFEYSIQLFLGLQEPVKKSDKSCTEVPLNVFFLSSYYFLLWSLLFFVFDFC